MFPIAKSLWQTFMLSIDLYFNVRARPSAFCQECLVELFVLPIFMSFSANKNIIQVLNVRKMDPRMFYGITRTKINNRVLALPVDSDDENLSDDDEYQLPKKTIAETDSESDSEEMENEVVYLQEMEPEDTEEVIEDIDETFELASGSEKMIILKKNEQINCFKSFHVFTNE